MAKEQPPEIQASPNLIWVPLCGWVSAVTRPIRYGEGISGGMNAFYAVIVIFLYATFAPCPPLMVYGLFFIGLAVFKRITGLWRHHYGTREVSAFEGYPFVCKLGIPEWFAKQFIEPGLVYLLGSHLADSRLRAFFVIGAGAALIKATFENVALAARDRAISDMRIQMEIDARRRRRNGW